MPPPKKLLLVGFVGRDEEGDIVVLLPRPRLSCSSVSGFVGRVSFKLNSAIFLLTLSLNSSICLPHIDVSSR